MANRNTQGFGLVPAGTLAGVSVQNQGKYFIDAGHSTTIYNGEALKSASGYVIGGQGSAAPVLGVLNGIFYNAADTLKPTFANFYKATITPANSEDITAFVLDNPLQQYVCGTDDAAAQALFLETFDFNTTAGSDTTGKSSATLDSSVTGNDDKQFRLLRSAEDPENEDATAAFASVVVCINLVELQS